MSHYSTIKIDSMGDNFDEAVKDWKISVEKRIVAKEVRYCFKFIIIFIDCHNCSHKMILHPFFHGLALKSHHYLPLTFHLFHFLNLLSLTAFRKLQIVLVHL